jgi:small subunit ribosomal protein S13
VTALRVAGTEIPNNKKVPYALQYVYGIGDPTAWKIVEKCGVDPEKRVRELSEEDVAGIRAEVEGGEYLIEGDRRRFNSMAVKRLVDISCYRGRRHVAGLPVRGQRTKTNARTRKGKAKTVSRSKKD